MPEPTATIMASGSAQAAGPVPAAPTRNPTRADWRLMLGLSRTESVLVVGADARELAGALSPWVRHVVGAVDEVPACDAGRTVEVLGYQASRPLAECSLDWIIFDGRIPGDRAVPTTVARVLPGLKPGGRVVMTFDNLWGVGGLLQPHRRASESDCIPCHGLAHARRLMAAAGLREITCYAMLPGRRAPRTLIPLAPSCPPAAEKFALNQAWKRASRRRATGRLALRLLVDLRLLRWLYPHYLLVGRTPC